MFSLKAFKIRIAVATASPPRAVYMPAFGVNIDSPVKYIGFQLSSILAVFSTKWCIPADFVDAFLSTDLFILQ